MDSAQIFESREPEDEMYEDAPGIKKVFINAKVIATGGTEWAYNEGCLSIPKIREDVLRPAEVTLQYFDEQFQEHTETFKGITARVILHEYDHIEGKLFIDYLKPLRRKMLQGKLNDISKGKMRVDYKMILAK
jgi:peptide deformylase